MIMFRPELPSPEKEQSNEEIIEQNLRLMNAEMQSLAESVGGNAGSVKIDGKRYPCRANNIYVNPENGEIVAVGNFQDVPEAKRNGAAEITLREAIGFDIKDPRAGFLRIVEILGKEKLSAEGVRSLEEAVRRYNETHASLIPEENED